ncbi:MAG: ATP-binding cassette domain-containing protein [Gemmatimonadales bacterium]
MSDPAIQLQSVTKRFGTVVALDGVDLEVAAGELVALIGESGSGKTTLIKTINRMVDIDTGRVTVEGHDVVSLDPIALRRRIGYVPQEGGLLPHWRVRRNVALVPWLRNLDARESLADRALELVGLAPDDYGDRWPGELSGGQRQRVAVARAVAGTPDLILLDEPFGALDAITRNELRKAFDSLRRGLRLTAVLVTHDIAEALSLGDRVAVMRRGRVEQLATPELMLQHPGTEYVAALLTQAGVR